MGGSCQSPSTPPRQITSINVNDLMQDLVVPPAPSKRFQHLPYERIRADRGTEKAHPIVSTAGSSQRLESGRVTKRPLILKPSTKSSKRTGPRVHFDDQPMTPKVMEPPTSPPSRPLTTRFRESYLDFDESPQTPDIMPEPTSPSTPHSCPDPEVKCSRCARIEQKIAKMAMRPKSRPSKASVTEVPGNKMTFFSSRKSNL